MRTHVPASALAALLICFSVGTIGGFALAGRFESSQQVTPTTSTLPGGTSVNPASGPVQVLVLIVDTLDPPPPRLDGAWLVTVLPDQKTHYWLGLSPASRVDIPERSPMHLADAYRLDQAQGQSSLNLTLQAVRSLLPAFQPAVSVTIDREAVRLILESRGSLALPSSGSLAAPEILAVLDRSAADPIAHLRLQAEILRALLDSYTTITYDGDVLPTVALLGPHLRSDVPINDLLFLAQASLPAASANMVVAPIREDLTLITMPDGSVAVVASSSATY